MPTPEDYDDNPGRALTHALVAMVAVAVLVGAAVGLAIMAAAELGGLGGGTGDAAAGPRDDSSDTLRMPPYQPTKDAGSGWDLPRAVESPSALPSSGPTSGSSAQPTELTLTASPEQVAPGERIDFNGVYPGGDGATLQVQRLDGSTWTDFPVTASVNGGSYGTWILTSRTGVTKFRVYDAAADRKSNVVTVQIG
jgi:hypothetical protein